MDLKILSTTVNDVFLSPQFRAENETQEEPEPALIQIIIQLGIPKDYNPPSKLISLTATLVGYESIGFPKGGFEQNQPYYSKKTIASASDLKLQAGSIYQFEVSFSVPQNTACYQRCKYGRHHQKVHVKATFPGLLVNKTLSAEKNIFFMPAVATTGFLPYYHVHRSAEEGLGPIFLGLRTQHLTVGGYLRVTFSLDSPSPTLQLRSLKLALLQQTTLKSRIRRNYSETPSAERITFFEVGPEELAMYLQHSGDEDGLDGLLALAKERHQISTGLDDSSSIPGTPKALGQCNWVVRMPNDSEARASTIPGSNCAIVLAHALELTIQYSDLSLGSSDVRTYRSSWGLILPSCACRWQTMCLPSYSPEDANPVPKVSRDFWAGKNEHESFTQCVCGEELSDLLRMEEQAASESELQASSEIWREMLSHRLQQRILRNGGSAHPRSPSSTLSMSRIASRRTSVDEGVSNNSRDRGRQPRGSTSSTGEGAVSSPFETGSLALHVAEGTSLGLIDAEDETEFEMQARELLAELDLDADAYQREWDRLIDLRQRQKKARNEYSPSPIVPRSQSANPTFRIFQRRCASISTSHNNSRAPSPTIRTP